MGRRATIAALLSYTALALGCDTEFEALVLRSGFEDAGGRPRPSELDARVRLPAFDAGVALLDPEWDAKALPLSDDAWVEDTGLALEDGSLPKVGREDRDEAGAWVRCDPLSALFHQGTAGESCRFEGGACGVRNTCAVRTAVCVGGALAFTGVTAHDCELERGFAVSPSPDVVGSCDAAWAAETGQACDAPRVCARNVPARPCCLAFTACTPSRTDSRPLLRHSEVCSDCAEPAEPVAAAIVSCAQVAALADAGQLRPSGARCRGSFVCTSDGRALHGAGQIGQPLDAYGALYWCGAGRLQRGVIGQRIHELEPSNLQSGTPGPIF